MAAQEAPERHGNIKLVPAVSDSRRPRPANALTATQVRLPPTLTRCAPASTISATDNPGTARTLTRFETAPHTARISSMVPSPGA